MERWAILMRPGWRADLTTAVILTGSYLLLIAFFAYVDVYNLHFFDAGYSLSYNLLRVVFAAYLFWIVTFFGSSLLALIGSNGLAPSRLRSAWRSVSLPARRCGRW